MAKSILLVGVGGQGTILAGKILSTGLQSAGYDVKMSEIHGMSQRGGAVSTHVRFGEVVHSPVIEKGGADVLISFEIVEALRWMSYLKPGGTVIINNQVILPTTVISGAKAYPDDVLARIKAVADTKVLDATQEAAKVGNPRGQNVLLVGATAKLLGLDNIDWGKVIAESVKPQFVEMNQKAFQKGFDMV